MMACRAQLCAAAAMPQAVSPAPATNFYQVFKGVAWHYPFVLSGREHRNHITAHTVQTDSSSTHLHLLPQLLHLLAARHRLAALVRLLQPPLVPPDVRHHALRHGWVAPCAH